jgi:hypothetical protein
LCVAEGFLQARGKGHCESAPHAAGLEPSGGVKAMTDEQLDAALEALRALLAEPAGEAANVLEGTAEAVALTAPDALSQRRYCRG